jgi:predicted nucleotide-binding protein
MFKDSKGLFRYQVITDKGEITASGGPYATREECLLSIVNLRLGLESNIAPKAEVQERPERPIETPKSQKIFIVHGRDEANKNLLRNIIADWGLEPIILAEEPNRGRTLIEKLLDHTSDVGYAFVLMTPDDVGSDYASFQKFSKDTTEAINDTDELAPALTELLNCLKPRVRQNVIFEYGLCIGSLKREKVCPLVKKGDIEIPTDILGYGYHSFTDSVLECKDAIAQELMSAGYWLRV